MRRIPRRRLHQAGIAPAVLSVEIPCNQRVDFVTEVVLKGAAAVIIEFAAYQVNISACSGNAVRFAVADSLTIYPGVGDIASVVVVKLKAERLRVEIQALMLSAYPDLAVSFKILQGLGALYFGIRQNLQSLLEGGSGLSLDNRPNLFKGGGKSCMIIRACAEDLLCEDVSAAEKSTWLIFILFLLLFFLISVSIIKQCFIVCKCFYKLFCCIVDKMICISHL